MARSLHRHDHLWAQLASEGKSRDQRSGCGVCPVVVLTGSVVHSVAPAWPAPTFEPTQLAEQFRLVKKHNATGLDGGKEF